MIDNDINHITIKSYIEEELSIEEVGLGVSARATFFIQCLLGIIKVILLHVIVRDHSMFIVN